MNCKAPWKCSFIIIRTPILLPCLLKREWMRENWKFATYIISPVIFLKYFLLMSLMVNQLQYPVKFTGIFSERLGIPWFNSVQLLSHVRLFATPWTAACQASLSITNSQSSLKPISIESVMPSNHLILSCPLLLLPSIFPSIRVFSNESALRIRWPKYWSFSFNISPSNEHPGLISFRMDWLDLLVERDLTVWITTNCAKFLKS